VLFRSLEAGPEAIQVLPTRTFALLQLSAIVCSYAEDTTTKNSGNKHIMAKSLFYFLLLLGAYHCTIASTEEPTESATEPAASEKGESPWEAATGNVSQQEVSETTICSGPDFCFDFYGTSLQDLLSPNVTEPAKLDEIRANLRAGKAVVINNAFKPEFAEAMHKELLKMDYKLQERFDADGFQVSQYNVYKWEDYNELMRAFHHVMDNPKSKTFMNDLTDRDTSGIIRSGASWFAPNGYVLPHDDHREMRTVSYVWHLSRNWLPEWGGALYWCPENHAHAYVHASFNTLTLFSVTTGTIHMVTPVNPAATEKRLTFNGWFTSSWFPSATDDLVSYLDTPKKRRELTEDQTVKINELVNSDVLDAGVRNKVGHLMALAYEENVGPVRFTHRLETGVSIS